MSEKESAPIENNEEIDSIIEKLSKTGRFLNNIELYQWEGFWFNLTTLKAAMVFKATFKSDPNDNDVLLASSMKTGTTWLKAICVSIMQGNKEEEDLLVKDNPHFHVPTIEVMDYYLKTLTHDLYTMPSPRLFHTHLPYRVLPDSIKNSDNCKIIYITRNPKDTLISMWHFFNYNRKHLENLSTLEEVVEYFCTGVHQCGPFFEHVLEYWEESKQKPQKILFLKYEDLKIDPKKEVAKIAMFLEKPFGNEEDLEIVLKKCSLERLKNLEVNKSGSLFSDIHNNSFFRKGIVGDWKNHMTPEMEEQLDKITSLKLQGSVLEL